MDGHLNGNYPHSNHPNPPPYPPPKRKRKRIERIRETYTQVIYPYSYAFGRLSEKKHNAHFYQIKRIRNQDSILYSDANKLENIWKDIFRNINKTTLTNSDITTIKHATVNSLNMRRIGDEDADEEDNPQRVSFEILPCNQNAQASKEIMCDEPAKSNEEMRGRNNI